MAVYVVAQFTGGLVSPIIGGYMYSGLNAWQPIFWLSFACCVATLVLCFFFLEETNYKRGKECSVPINTIVSPVEQPYTRQSEWAESDSDKKKDQYYQEQVVEVPEFSSSPDGGDSLGSHDVHLGRTGNGEHADVIHADTNRPMASRVSLKRFMRFARPEPNAKEIMWKGALRPVMALQLPCV